MACSIIPNQHQINQSYKVNQSKRGIFGFGKKAAPAQPTAKLIDSEGELQIDRYRGQLEDFIQNFDKYEEYLNDTQDKYDLQKDQPLQGMCTIEGTQRFKARAHQNNGIPLRNFRKPQHVPLELSTVGLGSYLGAPDDLTDFDLYNAAKLLMLSGGVNVLDTAINYRCQKSERTFGAALKTVIRKYGLKRDELFICTKNGYIPDDGDAGVPAGILIQDLIDSEQITKEDVANGIHCMHPNYLEQQFQQSKKNLGLETIDLMYLHNAYESQSLAVKDDDQFFDRLKKSFEFYESKIHNKELQYYGMATWICFRAKPEEEKIYLSLQKCLEVAEQIGGKDKHNFKFIQVPMGVAMPEAFVEPWQEYTDPNSASAQTEYKILVSLCNLLKMNVMASKPILEGRVNDVQIHIITNIRDNVSKHLQLIRSMPPRCIISTLVGMKKMENLKKNFEVIRNEPLTREEFTKIMQTK
eukprot:403369164